MLAAIETIWGPVEPAPEVVKKEKSVKLFSELAPRLPGELWPYLQRIFGVEFHKGLCWRDWKMLEIVYEFCATHGRLASFEAGWRAAEKDCFRQGLCPKDAFAIEDGECVNCGWKPEEA